MNIPRTPNARIANNIVPGFPQGVNSFVTNTASKIANVANNFKTSFVNTGTNMMKNIAEPVMESVEAVPTSGPSMAILLTLGLLVVIVGLIIAFHRQIVDGVYWLSDKIRTALGYTGKEAVAVTADVGKEVEAIAEDVANILTGQEAVSKILPGKKQVFNVSENRYMYSDAEPLCRAFGAELATYEQVKSAWEDGADWCNYGWVKGQAAVYPTQKDTWEKLQYGTDDQRLQCGMPGVNGGYFDNPDLRFGVNCYGDKPAETEHDIKRKLSGKDAPLTPEAVEQRKKELKYKSEIGQIGVLPFRQSAWSE
jgi:hypothetical protein